MQILKVISVVALVLALQPTSSAQSSSASQTYLWKLSGNGLHDSYIYINGITCNAPPMVSDKLLAAFDKTSVVVSDFDGYISQVDDKNKKIKTRTSDPKLTLFLSTSDRSRFIDILKQFGYPTDIDNLSVQQIELLYTIIVSRNAPCGSYKKSLKTEEKFRSLAIDKKKKYAMLQGFKEIEAISTSHNAAFWLNNLDYVINNEKEVKTALAKENNLYQDVKLEELSNLYSKNELYRLKFDNSQQREQIKQLTASIEKNASKASIFCSISATNVLPAGNSVFEELRKKGYTITPVTL
jgi:uncharacterized protein YbaP (TraB family)